MLEIFPFADKKRGDVARAALGAAEEAQRAIAAVNATRRDAQQPEIEFGLALHVGDVHYGNIGGANRLDFTVIGPAVNLASRIEGLTKELDQQVLVSADFAAIGGTACRLLGEYRLKGVAAARAIYAPNEFEP